MNAQNEHAARPLTFQLPNLTSRSVLVDLYEAVDHGGPAVVYLHGGAWVAGDRKDYVGRLTALQDRGITVASLGYTLATVASYPAQRKEIVAAADWLRAAGTKSVFVMGASAGAHLAASAAFHAPDAFDGFVGLFGRYDLRPESRSLVPGPELTVPAEMLDVTVSARLNLGYDDRLALLIGVPVDQITEEVLARVNPHELLSEQGPRMLLMHGTSDGVVDYRHSERLRDRAEQLGVECQLVLVNGANHEDPVFEADWTMDQIASFIHSSPSQ